MLVVTTNEISGWQIQRVCGEVFGLTVRSRNMFSQMGAGFKSMFGGELQGMTKNLADSRNEVMGRMLEHARSKGGNAVICMRFDTSEMGDVWTELCAYGTAVVLEQAHVVEHHRGRPAGPRRARQRGRVGEAAGGCRVVGGPEVVPLDARARGLDRPAEPVALVQAVRVAVGD